MLHLVDFLQTNDCESAVPLFFLPFLLFEIRKKQFGSKRKFGRFSTGVSIDFLTNVLK